MVMAKAREQDTAKCFLMVMEADRVGPAVIIKKKVAAVEQPTVMEIKLLEAGVLIIMSETVPKPTSLASSRCLRTTG